MGAQWLSSMQPRWLSSTSDDASDRDALVRSRPQVRRK
jgi:hypothetical protein